MGETCEWMLDEDPDCGDSWDTECGRKWEFSVGGPAENGCLYCPYCGRQLTEARSREAG